VSNSLKPKTQHLKPNGFTLIETMISVLIFGLVLSAVSSLLSSNLSSASLIKNNFVASGLVQEGMEVVRNIRDNEWHGGQVFGTSIIDGIYNVQWNSVSLMTYDSSRYLKRDDTSGLFSYDSGTTTIFKRSITIATVVPNVEKKIVVDVSWSEKGRDKTISAEEHLFNWR
jgi:prepilin-type N-terminal cleavage/methylation domain-containing protein